MGPLAIVFLVFLHVLLLFCHDRIAAQALETTQVSQEAALQLADCSKDEFLQRQRNLDLSFSPANIKLIENTKDGKQYWVVGAAQENSPEYTLSIPATGRQQNQQPKQRRKNKKKERIYFESEMKQTVLFKEKL